MTLYNESVNDKIDADKQIRYLHQALLDEKNNNSALQKELTQVKNELKNIESRLHHEKYDAMYDLAMRMAHDLKNPLSVIRNTVEIIESKPKLKIEEKIIHYGKIFRAINRMSHQIDDVLEYLTINQISVTRCVIKNLIEQALGKITIPNEIQILMDKVYIVAICDEQKMIVVFKNLLLNAIQSISTSGTVKIVISEDKKVVSVSIIDSGPGIREELMHRIFDPLCTTKQEGTGLGLSVCKKIISLHSGKILVKNNPTTFTVVLPKPDA